MAPNSGLTASNFLRAFLYKGLPVPGTGSVPSAVWKVVVIGLKKKYQALPSRDHHHCHYYHPSIFAIVIIIIVISTYIYIADS
jgi:hypothetical protein